MKLPSRTVPDLASQLNFEKLERTVDSEPVTSLPTTDLYVGRRIVYVADAANGVHWDLVLTDPNATYPWAYVGGPPLTAEVSTSQTTTTTSYTDLGTVGPSVTLPALTGDFTIGLGAEMNCSVANYVSMSVALGAATAVDADAIVVGGVAVADASAYREIRRNGIAASAALVAKYKTGAGTGQFQKRVLSVRPIRVG